MLPELNGKIHGMAFRVPTSTVSVTDFVAVLEKDASVDDINKCLRGRRGQRPERHPRVL